MKRPIHALMALSASLAVLVPHAAGAQTGPAPVSQAETLLFETDHLAHLQTPALLVYDFRKVSNVEQGFSDKVSVDVASNQGKTNATLHFLSGAHRHDVPAVESAHGNPVLLGFLERDIAEMKRLTGGSTAYFRKRIRMALAEAAEVSKQTITYQGKPLPAQAIRIQPYLDDPMHARFEPYVHKTYVFIVSDQVPGGVYQLRNSLANPDRMAAGARTPATAAARDAPAGKPAAEAGQGKPGAALPAIEETLTLVSVAHPKR